ncbi:beta-lactamase-like protein [Gorgonomyces haynaldii]|nr:beta-lactamase-like protein [Gorgonomyces haynaldii]
MAEMCDTAEMVGMPTGSSVSTAFIGSCRAKSQQTTAQTPKGLHTNTLGLPRSNKNRRRNTSGLLRVEIDGVLKNILIDCGKTFYESAMTWFTEYNIRRLDGVLLTHGHADAIMGMDDLRQFTIGKQPVQDVVPIYLNQETLDVVSRAFPYLYNRQQATGGGEVAKLEFNLIEHGKPFNVSGIDIVPFDGKPHKSHWSHQEALDALRQYLKKGGTGYFTGFTHELLHTDLEKWVQSQITKDDGFQVEIAYDGLQIKFQA